MFVRCENITLTTSILAEQQTMEVATARVYNWDIGQKRKEKEAEGS